MRASAATIISGTVAIMAAFLVIPGGAASLIAFELLLVLIVVTAVGRIAPPDGIVDGPLPARRRRHDVTPYVSLPAGLRRMERLVRYGRERVHSANTRLLPELRDLADQRLTQHHGVGLLTDPAAAARLLGPDAWSILGPEWRQRHPSDAGPGIDDLEAVVDAIERLGTEP